MGSLQKSKKFKKFFLGCNNFRKLLGDVFHGDRKLGRRQKLAFAQICINLRTHEIEICILASAEICKFRVLACANYANLCENYFLSSTQLSVAMKHMTLNEGPHKLIKKYKKLL